MVKKTFLAIAAAAFLFGGAATVTPTSAEACWKKDRGHHSKVMGWKARKGGGGWMSSWREKRAERKAMRAEKRSMRKGNRMSWFPRMRAKKA